jgi:hypothetical protein
MTRRLRGHLGKMRDAKDLMIARDFRHLFADHAPDFAADIRVDFIEDKQRHVVQVG